MESLHRLAPNIIANPESAINGMYTCEMIIHAQYYRWKINCDISSSTVFHNNYNYVWDY